MKAAINAADTLLDEVDAAAQDIMAVARVVEDHEELTPPVRVAVSLLWKVATGLAARAEALREHLDRIENEEAPEVKPGLPEGVTAADIQAHFDQAGQVAGSLQRGKLVPDEELGLQLSLASNGAMGMVDGIVREASRVLARQEAKKRKAAKRPAKRAPGHGRG